MVGKLKPVFSLQSDIWIHGDQFIRKNCFAVQSQEPFFLSVYFHFTRLMLM